MSYGFLRPQHPITQQLLAARQASGWSQARMAETVPTRQDTISRVESGQSPDPHLWTVIDMAAALGLAVCLEDEEEWW